MRRLLAGLLVGLTGLGSLAAPAAAEDLAGRLALGENLEIYLFPEPSLFQRVFGAIGLASPPEPLSLDDVASNGRDDVVVAEVETGEGYKDWSLFARVRPAEGEEYWYDIGKPTTKFWEMKLKDGVVIKRVKKSAEQIFEGGVEGNPWFLQVAAKDALQVEGEVRPELVGIKFWLDEYVFNYDEITHSTSSGRKKVDNYSVLRDALVTALPDELGMDTSEEDNGRFRGLQMYVERAQADDLVPLRDLLEAKVERLEKADTEDEDGRDEAKLQYGALLEKLRERTSDG